MKKMIAIFLSLLILLPCIIVSAEENQKFYSINFDVGNGKISKKAIIKDNEIYLSADDFSDITRYSYNYDEKAFVIKGQELSKSFKCVFISPENKKILVKPNKMIDLTDCFTVDKKIYLPFSQMLPILNAEIYAVENNIIFISNNRLSLAEVLYDFFINDYSFNFSKEFNNSGALASFFFVPNYILNTITNFRYDRLDIVDRTGDYNDYKDIFSEFLADDNLYLKAKAQNSSSIDTTINAFKTVDSAAKNMKSVYDWVETVGKTTVSSDVGGKLLESLKAYYASGDLKTDDLKGLNDAWTSGSVSLSDCLETISYIYTCVNQVDDNRKMLDSVYNISSYIPSNVADRKAARQVYDLYGGKVVPAIIQEIREKIAGDMIKKYASPIAIYTATAKVAGIACEAVLPFSPSDISKLPLYSNVVLSASASYSRGNTVTDTKESNFVVLHIKYRVVIQ